MDCRPRLLVLPHPCGVCSSRAHAAGNARRGIGRSANRRRNPGWSNDAGIWVAMIGTTELRELRGRIPWYGTLANHAGLMLPASGCRACYPGLWADAAGGRVRKLHWCPVRRRCVLLDQCCPDRNAGCSSERISLSSRVLVGDARGFATSSGRARAARMADDPDVHSRLVDELLFALPLYMIRLANQRLVEMREMFTQTIAALAHAVDKRDPYTTQPLAGGSRRSPADIGRVMRLSRASWRPSSGAACSMTSARSASRTTSCSSTTG